MTRFFSLLLGLLTALLLALPGLPYAFQPTLKIDAAAPVAQNFARCICKPEKHGKDQGEEQVFCYVKGFIESIRCIR